LREPRISPRLLVSNLEELSLSRCHLVKERDGRGREQTTKARGIILLARTGRGIPPRQPGQQALTTRSGLSVFLAGQLSGGSLFVNWMDPAPSLFWEAVGNSKLLLFTAPDSSPRRNDPAVGHRGASMRGRRWDEKFEATDESSSHGKEMENCRRQLSLVTGNTMASKQASR
jgi:hypothetical protein